MRPRVPGLRAVALAAGLFGTAGLAHAEVLVSNFSHIPNTFTLHNLLLADIAQRFKTGPASGTFTLTSVDILALLGTTSTVPIVTVREGNPRGTTVATLTHSGGTFGPGQNANHSTETFRAPANTALEPNTTYYVRLEHPGSTGRIWLRSTTTGSDDPGAASGWSLHNQLHSRPANSDGSFSIAPPGAANFRPLLVRINGEVPAPVITSVAVSSMPRTHANTYWRGEQIKFSVTFSAPVKLTGEPHFEFELGPSGNTATKQAALVEGADTDSLVFAYTVVEGNWDMDGIWVGDQSQTIKLGSGERITDNLGSVDAVLTHNELGIQSGHLVNGSRLPPSDDATLERFRLTAGGNAVALDPPFANDITSYRAWVRNNVSGVRLTATPNHDDATVSYPEGRNLSLSPGRNAGSARVTAEDMFTTLTYDVTVVREAAQPPADPDAVLTANVTVGEGAGTLGYADFATDWGAIAPTEFRVGGTTYDLAAALVVGDAPTSFFTAETVAFCFGARAPVDDVRNRLELNVDGHEFDLDDGRRLGTQAPQSKCYAWPRPAGLDWAWGDITSVKLTINHAPDFGEPILTRSVVENTPADEDVGEPFVAEDADGDAVTYSLEGPDKDNFTIDSSTGQIRTKAVLDYEAQTTHSVRVKADDGRSGGATRIDVTIEVVNVDEPRDPLETPSVIAPRYLTNSLVARWRVRSTGDEITAFEVEYRRGTSGSWTRHPDTGLDPFRLIESLRSSAEYQVRVRMVTTGVTTTWSEPGTGRVRGQVSDATNTGTVGATIFYPDANVPGGTPAGVHFGEPFEIRIRFTDNIRVHERVDDFTGPGNRTLYLSGPMLTDLIGPDRAIGVIGGRVSSIETFSDNTLWVLQIEPSSRADLTLTLEPLPCNTLGSLCSQVSGSGLRQRTVHRVRGIRRVPSAPADLMVQTVQERGADRLQVSFAGTNEAKLYRLQYKLSDHRWSQARDFWNWRRKGPDERHSVTSAPVTQGLAYDVRVRWENPIGNGAWSYSARPGYPLAQWGETLTWRKVSGRVEIYVHYNRDLDRNSRLSDAQYLYDVHFTGSQSSGFAVDEISIIDDYQGRPRVVRLRLGSGVSDEDVRNGANLWVTYARTQVVSPRPPGVLDQDGNQAPGFFNLEAIHVPNANAPALYVSDTTVQEARGARANFEVTLRPAATAQVTVDYETVPVSSATPGEDYTHTSGTLTFNAGQTAKTVSVLVLDDFYEDSGETFRLKLENPQGGNAYIADAWGIATILNEDPLPVTTPVTALTAEFVRMPAHHVGDAFTFTLRFSEEVSLSLGDVTGSDGQQGVLSVTGGQVTGASRVVEGENRTWSVTVTPNGEDDVTVSLPETTDCDATGGVCTGDDRPLSAAVTARVIGLQPPAPQSATIPSAGDQLQLFFDRAFDNRTGRTPPKSAFVVNADGVLHLVSSIEASVSDQWIRLSFVLPIKAHQTVTVSYRDPTDGDDYAALQLRSGEDAESFSGFAAINGSTVSDPAAPVLVGPAQLNAAGDELSLRFTRALDFYALPAPEAFAVTYDGSSATVTGVRGSDSDSRAIALDISPAIPASAQTVTVTYSDPTAGDDDLALQNRAGVDAESFSQPVSRVGTPLETSLPVPLTAQFWKLPAIHGGNSFKFELVFSDENVSVSHQKIMGSNGQSDVLSVTNGAVTAARRLVPNKNHNWEITITPNGDEDVTITLPASADCEAQGAICTDDARPLSAAVVATVLASSLLPLTATIEGAPQAHEGMPFVLQVRFSEATAVSWTAMRDHVLSVTNGEVTRARRLNGEGPENAAWEITLEPTGGDVTVQLPATTDCEAEDAVCTEDDRPLEEAVTATISQGTVPPLTAEFDAPAEHDSSEDFTVWLNFNGAVDLNQWMMANRAVAVTGGRIRSAEHEIGLRHSWRLTVAPTSIEDVVLSVAPPESCDDSGALCATDGRKLSSGTEVRVKGPASIPLTAKWRRYSDGHDGSKLFVLEAEFSWPVTTSREAMYQQAVRVTNGEATNAFPKDNQPKIWVFWIKPLYNETIRVELLPTTDCEAEGAICTEDGRPLSNRALWDIMPSNPNAVDETAPELQRAEVDGAHLVLLYREGLDETSTPAEGAFTVTVGGQPRSLAASNPVAVDGRRIRLTLASAVAHGDTVTVGYTVPTENPIQDRAQNAAAALSDQAVTNHTPEGDTTAPELLEATASTDSVVLTYSEALDESSTPVAAAFAVTVADQAQSLAETDPVVVSGSTVTLTFASAIAHGEPVTVRYTVLLTNPLQDPSGNLAASATITTRVPEAQQAPGEPVTATFESVPTHHAETAFTFRLAFSEEFPVDAAVLRDSALEVTNGQVTGAEPVEAGKSQTWTITVEPSSQAEVTIALQPKESCTETGALCTEDDRGIAEAVSATVLGPEPVPYVTEVSVTSDPGSNGVWDTGEAVAAEVQFSGPVTVVGPPGVGPRLGILLDGIRRDADYTGGSGSARLRFSYAVTAADAGARKARVAANGLSLNGTVLGDSNGQEAELDFATAPYVTGVELVADASGDGIWTHGETIEVRITFNEAVSVGGGSPILWIAIAGAPQALGYVSGSGSATLVFSLEVPEGDTRFTQIGVTANGLTLGSSSIVSMASRVAADLSHEGTEPTAAPDPDESVLLTAEFRELPASHDESAFTFALHFSEEFDLSRTTLQDHALEVTNGELTGLSRQETGKNQAWNVTVTPGGDEDVTITLAATTDCEATGAICTADNRPLAATVSATVVGPDEEEDPPESNTVVLEPPAQRDDRDIGAITLTADPPGTIQAAWEEPTETPANYRISWAKVGENFLTWTDPSGNAYPTEPAYTITDLDEGEEYKVKVLASYSGTAGDWSGEAVITVAESPSDNQPAVPLTASFESVPSSHDESAFTFALHFSEEFSLSRTTLHDHALEVTNGELTGLSRLERGKNQAWNVTVTPNGDEDVTITLVATTDCAATGAICTADNRPLSASVSATVVGPLSLSVADASATEADDATVDFTVTLSRASSADVTVDYATSDGTATAGADYTDTSGTLTFAAGETAKTVAVPVLDDATDEDDETLTLTLSNASGGGGVSLDDATATGTIADDDEASAQPLTASFENVPSSHDESAFTFALHFSEEFDLSRTTLHDHALEVTNGELTGVGRQETGKNQAWNVTVVPDGDDDVTITLAATTDCAATGAICTADNRPLSAAVSATVVGPLSLSVADASATEADDATVDFTVTLSRASSSDVTVDYATSDGTATAGADYTDTSGTLTFAAGETAKTVSVPVLDDATDEDDETLTLTLSGASGGGVSLDDGTATGTIADDDEASAQPLTARFENVPASHDESAFTFALRFSEEFSLSYTTLQDHALEVTNGELTGLSRLERGKNQAWNVTVVPDGDEDVTITLAATTDCAATGAICTADNRPLSAAVSATVVGPLGLSVADASATEADATVDFTVTLSRAASTSVTVDYATSDGTATAGADYTSTSGTLTFAAGETAKTVAVSVLDDAIDEDAETLTLTLTNASGGGVSLDDGTATGTIADDDEAPAQPLTASFEAVPASHDGVHSFKFEVHFSEDVEGLSYTTLRDAAFSVTNGRVTGARRLVSGNNQGWEITVEPNSPGAVTISLPAGAVGTPDARQLEGTSSATVQGPPGLSVADARATEAAGATVDFAVTLSRAASASVTVDYATSDGSATVGEDYTSTSGTLTFAAGETAKTVAVPVLDDAINEGAETFALTLTNASGGEAYLAEATATGTIENSAPVPGGLLARFGRMTAVQVVEYVEERLRAPREPGFQGQLAGWQLRRDLAQDATHRFAQGLGSQQHRPRGGSVGSLTSSLTSGDLLTGSSWTVNRQTKQGSLLSFWSRGARASFVGREQDLGLNGNVRTVMLGADYAQRSVLAGLSLAHSWGLGNYTGNLAGGRVASSVTGLYPWLGYRLTDRITVWAVGGLGLGGMRLSPSGALPQEQETGLSMAMAAAGTRGDLMPTGASGFRLAYKADALWVETSSAALSDAAGNLAATGAVVHRVRTALEGSHPMTVQGRLSLNPSVVVGLRHDGGDAETGTGLDAAVGVVVSDPSTGLEVDGRVRMLLAHEVAGYRERGLALSLSYNPTPATPLGWTVRMAPSWGSQATSGAEALWGRQTMAGMGSGGYALGSRLDADLGYGLPLGRRLVGTPQLGYAASGQGQSYRVGYRIGTLASQSVKVELDLAAQRRASSFANGADNGILGRATLSW